VEITEGFYGVVAWNADEIDVIDSNIFYNAQHGIFFLGNVSNSLILNNIVQNNKQFGIRLQSGENNRVINNTSTGNTDGVYFATNSHGLIANNNASSNADGILLVSGSNNNTVVNNKANNNDIATNFDGLLIRSSSNNRFISNEFNENVYNGIYIYDNSSDNLFVNNTMNGNLLSGIHLENAFNNLFLDSEIDSSGQDAILLEGISENNTFSHIGISNTNLEYFDLNIVNPEVDHSHFVNTPVERYSINGNIMRFVDEENGEIYFTEDITGIGVSLSEDIRILFNLVGVNSEENPGLDASADITLYNLPEDFENPGILRDGLECSPNICEAYTDLNAGTVSFGVSEWTEYSIGEL
jgi:parallel beta-helix repeat protein